MTEWIITCNTDAYDVAAAFNKLKMLDWKQSTSIEVGDTVYIWDNKNITVEDIADIYDTINYEVISTISDRVVREYIQNI